ncbi:MAG: Hsp20/alpha crystallin family protein [Deltaproteobacteria bacterium]|nr:MAG: Hsp20/alpha crystallin family protein [Deltaproteobacteria bacterium]
MDFIKIRFGGNLDRLNSRIGKTIEEMFRSVRPIFNYSECSWKPQVDIYETSDNIIIFAEISGVEKENLELEITNRAVRICGTRSEMPCFKNGRYRLAEIQYGHFERLLNLPSTIDTEKVKASYTNGFLEITLAKLPLNKSNKIPISEG